MSSGNLEGQILGGRYEIQGLIGQGGMASVYKAYDPNLSRTVAIKIIHPHLSGNPDFTRRFEEEATIVAHLRHPNIIQVFDFNHADALYYMVMEFIAGETLQTRLARLNNSGRQMPIKDALRFAAEICDAAEYAHQRGMIHRDIKPANVMLDVHGKAILMDFGIARMVGGHHHTATGAVVGTALYMAPEQIQGLQTDARTDIYALGVTLFEMLSGKPPFQADSAMTLMMMHLNDPIPDICDLQPETPRQVVEIIQRAMAKDREERYPSAAKMAAHLRGVGTDPAKAAPTAAAAVAAAVGQPAAVDATLIERPAAVPLDGTLIEAGGAAIPAARAASQSRTGAAPRGETLVEAAVKPMAGAARAEATFPTRPEQSAYPVERKRGKGWLFALLGLILVVGIGGFFAFRVLSSSGGLGGNLPGMAVVEATPTIPLAELNVSSIAETADISQAVAAVVPAAQTAAPIEPSSTAQAVVPIEPSPTAQAVVPIEPSPTAQAVVAPAMTDTPAATATESAPPTPAAPVIGGADKIAFFNGGEIWVANLDGSELTQLSDSGSVKTYLRWLPDGQGLSYISGKCLRTVSLAKEDQVVTCFNNAKYLSSFEVSPDGSQAAISLDNQLYLIPYDLLLLSQAKTHGDLANMAGCKELAPYARNFGKAIRWSANGTQWAALIMGVLKDGRRGDLIQVFAVDRCIPNPQVKAQFPEPHFSYRVYQTNPAIESFSWDGNSLFVFTDMQRNGGFGDLHLFNMEKFTPNLAINPIDQVCCYRDPQWSPDGSYLVFAFQNYKQGANSATQLYLIPYGDIGTGVSFKPLPLPEISDPRGRPEAVLRPAQP